MKKYIITGVICGGIGLFAGYKITANKVMNLLNSEELKQKLVKEFEDEFLKTKKTCRNKYKSIVEDVIFGTMTDAMDAINSLNNHVTTYNSVSVADLYDIAGIVSKFEYNKYGWTDVSSAEVIHNKYGYIIKIDEPKILK